MEIKEIVTLSNLDSLDKSFKAGWFRFISRLTGDLTTERRNAFSYISQEIRTLREIITENKTLNEEHLKQFENLKEQIQNFNGG